MNDLLTIALDGPAGAGKSTIAKLLARRLGILYLDTGAMYRAVGLKAIRCSISVRDEAAVAAMLQDTRLEIIFESAGQRIMLDGEDVSAAIRTPEASIAASDVSALPAVRIALVKLQREIAARQSLILDGRDIGTYVLPDAPCKFFMTADPAERARRRLLDLQSRGDSTSTIEQVLADIKYRDHQDASRSLAPLRQADDAVLIDTTDLSIEQVVETIMSYITKEQHEA